MAKTSSTPVSKLEKLKKFSSGVKSKFRSQHQDASQWMEKQTIDVGTLRHRSQDLLAAASLAGSLAIQSSVDTKAVQQLVGQADAKNKEVLSHITQDEYQTLIDKMRAFVMMSAGHLEKDQELYLEQQLTDLLGFEVTAELDGHRLNHSLGVMGGEQHLRRFPSDDLSQHDAYLEAGIAPGRGAFGWFTEDGQLTSKAIMREKYYFAVQTLYLPDWNTNHSQLKPWYKFRKMIAINPHEELAVVAVVGDAGPALWVKKQFGGSPEVIREAKVWSPKSRGKVILLFVDDPQDKIPLGVINLNEAAPQVI